MTETANIATGRACLEVFSAADVPALAAILAEPEVTRTITANGSTAERCRASAEQRIAWHNKSWESHGYGVWAVKARDPALAEPGDLIGWCGFTEPDIGEDPEILYGLAPAAWGQGLATEVAGAAIDWLFAETGSTGVSALIFARLNPASIAIAKKLGMTRRGTMAMPDFMPDLSLARNVLDYEIWRLAEGRSADPETLLFQAPYKAGQIASLGLGEHTEIEEALCAAARGRESFAAVARAELEGHVREAFSQGLAEPYLDWYHLPRAGWKQPIYYPAHPA